MQKTWLEELGRVSSAAISVFDLNRKTHVYFSRLYRERLGLPDHKQEGPEGFDLLIATESGIHFLNMLIDLKPEKRMDFKLVSEFRICKPNGSRSEEHTSELQSRGHLVCRLLLEKKNKSENQNSD